MKIIIYSYAFFILANTLDILSSIGQMEENEFMRTSTGLFSLHLGVEIKLLFLCYYLIMSLWIYVCLRGFHKPFASLAAAAIPAYATYSIFGVACQNILLRIVG